MDSEIPVVKSSKDPQGSKFLIETIINLQMISHRIEEDKKKFIETIGKDILQNTEALNMLKLDILSIFIFANMYLDYLVRYITKNWFTESEGLEGLKVNSFIAHIKSLNDVFDEDLIFNEYKDFLLKNGIPLAYKIGNIKNVIKQRFTGLREDIIYDLETSNYFLILQKEKSYDLYFEDGIEKIHLNPEIEKEVFILATKHKISTLFDDESKFGRIIYLDTILKNLEFKINLYDIESEKVFKKVSKKYRNIIDVRIRLGLIFNEKDLYQLVIDFTSGIKDILNKGGI
jgi:hypothetical protein